MINVNASYIIIAKVLMVFDAIDILRQKLNIPPLATFVPGTVNVNCFAAILRLCSRAILKNFVVIV